MYRDTGAGKEPVPPALLAMGLVLQGYLGMSDFDAVEASVFDARWQMVLGRLGETEPAFCQGALQAYRERLIANDMDPRLVERTIELARATSDFDWKKLPKTLRVATDSSPLEGAGRVEDTINLLAHAGRKVIECAAELLGRSVNGRAGQQPEPGASVQQQPRTLSGPRHHGSRHGVRAQAAGANRRAHGDVEWQTVLVEGRAGQDSEPALGRALLLLGGQAARSSWEFQAGLRSTFWSWKYRWVPGGGGSRPAGTSSSAPSFLARRSDRAGPRNTMSTSLSGCTPERIKPKGPRSRLWASSPSSTPPATPRGAPPSAPTTARSSPATPGRGLPVAGKAGAR